ncbi:MAG: helix-turn-helix domain-containing protein [Methanobacteriota archaeon]
MTPLLIKSGREIICTFSDGATMQDSPVMIREDVTVSLDKELIDEMLGIAEIRGITLSTLVRDVLGAFCKVFRSGTDWTCSDLPLHQPVQIPISGSVDPGADQIAFLTSRVTAHDEMITSLQSRIAAIESGTFAQFPHVQTPSFSMTPPTGLHANISTNQNRISDVIDCDAPVQGGVSDDALVKLRDPVSPVFTSVDVSTIGRISPTQVYSQTEAAALLNISISTIRKYVKERKIASRKIGRSTVFQGQDLLAYSERMR